MSGADKSHDLIKRRLVLFFPGFEPLGAEKHRQRFERAAAKSALLYDAEISCGPLIETEAGLPRFEVLAKGKTYKRKTWETKTDFVVFDWSSILVSLNSDHFSRAAFQASKRFSLSH